MSKKGFTLIELLASLAIASVLILLASMIFSLSLNTSAKAYEDELAYKESTVGALYINNIIRSSYRIDLVEGNPDSNLKAYVSYANDSNTNQISSYEFITAEVDGVKYLYAIIDNQVNNSNKDKLQDPKPSQQSGKGSKVRIARCSDLYLYYDNVSKIVTLRLNTAKPSTAYENIIHVGKRL